MFQVNFKSCVKDGRKYSFIRTRNRQLAKIYKSLHILLAIYYSLGLERQPYPETSGLVVRAKRDLI
jgi:hypothetical protein